MAERLFLRLADDPLYAPETTVPAGTMQEFVVPPALAPFVANAMGYAERLPAGAVVTERVLPDGAMRLIADTAGGTLSLRVAGADPHPALLTHQGEVQGLSLTLRPGASRVLFGLEAHALAGRSLPWDEVACGPARDLPHRLHAARTPQARMQVLFAFLQPRAQCAPDATGELDRARTHAALRLLRESTSRRPVSDAAAQLGLGERRLEQLFRAHVGLGPKAWHRLARFHACVRLLRRSSSSGWAELALEAGFHDQAHLANEFRAFSGLTPEGYARENGISGLTKTRG